MSKTDAQKAEKHQEPVSRVFQALETNVPLALLIDLCASQGPDSDQILHDENPCDTSWISQRPTD